MSKSERARCPYDGVRLWSAITHGMGVVLALFGAGLMIPIALLSQHRGALFSVIVYLTSLTALYTASTLYHSIRTGERGRIRLRKLDHLNIYLLIAGTYTPFCILALSGAWRVTILSVIWGLALAGIIINLFLIHLPRWLTSGIYLGMGWIVIIAIYPLSQSLGAGGTFWLLFGGGLYTIGGVLYALKWPGRNNRHFGCHEIFHVFILLGSIAHYGAVLYTLR